MKKVAILASLAGALMLTAYAGNTTKTDNTIASTTEVVSSSKGRVYNAVVEQSEVKWNGKKIGGEHYGAIAL